MRIGEYSIALGATLVVLFLAMFMARRETPPETFAARWENLTLTHENKPVVKGIFAPTALDVRVDGGLLPDSADLELLVRPQNQTGAEFRAAPMLTVPGEGLLYRRELKNQDIGRGYEYYFRLHAVKDSTGVDTTLAYLPQEHARDSGAVMSVYFVGKPQAGVLVGHIATMFAAFFCGALAMMRTLDGESVLMRRRGTAALVVGTAAFLLVGVFIFGPRVEMQTYGIPWSGFPNGTNLTSTLSVVVFAVWLILAVGLRGTLLRNDPSQDWIGTKRLRFALMIALVLMVVTYLIPHGAGRM